MTLRLPRWISIAVAAVAESILVIFTLVIIAAMWLPAYLTNSGQTTGPLQGGIGGSAARPEPMHVPHQQ